MFRLSSSITLIPALHGSLYYSQYVRDLCSEKSFDCIAVDIPSVFDDNLPESVDALPLISALIATRPSDPVCYVPVDPCDAFIEGIRQSRQRHIRGCCIGSPILGRPAPLPLIPDPHASEIMGIDAYTALCLETIDRAGDFSHEDAACRSIACRLHDLEATYAAILAVVHFRHTTGVIRHFKQEYSYNYSLPEPTSCRIMREYINPDHLYFALSELPFIAGKFEKERQNPFASRIGVIETIKDLFRETRDDYYSDKNTITELSPTRIDRALTYLRNLTVMTDMLMPSLFDIVTAAKGVGGNSYAVKILKNAKYYPFLPIEQPGKQLDVGIDRLVLPEDGSVHDAVNLFKDLPVTWQRLNIKPDPSGPQKKKYRFRWNPAGICSHVPEDRKIEEFNAHLRNKAQRVLTEDLVRSEKFVASVKDGIDFRETLRNWHTGDIYIKEVPPSRGNLDTVIIIFDSGNDDRYPHRATWYAEHDQESTLTFFATNPFDDVIGPGIVRSRYGGLSLLFPPRVIPNAFEITADLPLKNLTERLAYGALLFSEEQAVAFVSPARPALRLRRIAARLKKHLVWIPLSSFSSETIRKLRRFHVLNGKIVRSWASHFIGD
ncbi:MAG: hypothetical protein GF350_14885 [Chitinivibrionales bacterium]|nr:hypothetical protein [Chitinivibrionales bacterium]